MYPNISRSPFRIIFLNIFIYALTIYGCKKNNVDNSPNPIVNNPPGQFVISLLDISSDTASITWTKSADPEGGSVNYNLYLNDTLKISNYSSNEYTFRNLHELTAYRVKIVAVDSKQNETSETLNITTKKYWLTYLKKLDYGSISGYSSQKCGQMIKANEGDGYIIVGETELSGGASTPFNMFAMKIDTLGNKIWQKYYEYTVGNSIEIKVVKNKSDGYIISGGNNLISVSNDGTQIWHQTTTTTFNVINGIAVNNAGQIYTAGYISFDSSSNVMAGILSEYDADGNLLWNKEYSPTVYDQLYDIKIDVTGQLIILGMTDGLNKTRAEYNAGGQDRYDFWVLKTTDAGDIIWSNTYRNEYGQYAFPENIIETSEGNLVFTGFIYGSYDITFMHLQMIDVNGNNIWKYFREDNYTKAYSVSETNDNSLIVVGGYQMIGVMDAALYKFDKNGNELWKKRYGDAETFFLNKTVIPTSDGGYIINCQKSKAYNFSGETDQIYIFKTNDIGEF